MGTVLGALCCLAAVALEVVFLATGAGAPPEPGGPAPLGGLGGSPWLAIAGGGLFVGGAFLLGRPRRPDEPYATREVILLLAVGAAAAFTVAAFLGVLRGWKAETLGVVALAAIVETLIAAGLAVRLATVAEKRRGLFLPGVVAAAALGVLHLVLVTLSAT